MLRSTSSIIQISREIGHNNLPSIVPQIFRPARVSPRTLDDRILQAEELKEEPSDPQPLHPTPPSTPLRPTQTRLLPLIPHNPQPFDIPPLSTPPLPPRLPHQTDNCLFLAPSLLDGYVRQVGRIVALGVVGERDPDAVGAEGPVERVRGWGEIREEGDRGGKGAEFGKGDGGKTVIIKCTMYTYMASQLVRRYCHFILAWW